MKNKIFLLLVFVICSFTSQAQWLWDINTMKTIRDKKCTLSYSLAYQSLLRDAEEALKRPNYSVTYKGFTSARGNKHDYVSLSRYWWPNPQTADGMPYIHKDGQSNPELNKYDRNRLSDMCNAVNTLSLAYFYTHDERYATKAVQLIKTWFLNKETKMNPNLDYSQIIPGRDDSKGHQVGVIDSYSFVELLNSIQLLKESPAFTKKDEKELKRWFSGLSKWLLTSSLGQEESQMLNNHSISYDVQLLTYSIYSGNMKLANQLMDGFLEKRICKQIEPDGQQPQELRRTLAFGYSEYNIRHIIDFFSTAKSLGKELYKSESADGRSLYKAVDFLCPYLGKEVSEWPYQQISDWDAKQQEFCEDLYRIYQLDTTRTKYLTLYETFKKHPLSDRNRLFFGGKCPIEEALDFASRQFDCAFLYIDSILKGKNEKKYVNPRSVNRDGSFRMVGARDWCSGFFPGSLWYLYAQTKDEKWKDRAINQTLLIEKEKFDTSSHDVGFKMNNSFGNAYRFTSQKDYKDILIQSASTLSRRFNPVVGAIRSWDFNKNVWQYPVIIDNMMNLELLFSATQLTGDSTYYYIADIHAATTLKNHFRKDYSSYHVVDYDTISGKAIQKQTHQGYSDESAWARGQAWGFYGFTMAYRYTHKKTYLDQAEHILDFLINHPNMPQDMIPYWDFNVPSIPNTSKDVSAACIIASSLYELSDYIPDRKEEYILLANKIVGNLLEYYRAPLHTNYGFLLLHSTGNHPGNDEIDVPISYADYYLMEALYRCQIIE